jgi:hypothetical protein
VTKSLNGSASSVALEKTWWPNDFSTMATSTSRIGGITIPFGDPLATKSGIRYFIGVKARNEMRQGNVGLNESLPDALNRRLKEQGKTTDQITAMLLAEVSKLATDLNATPAWATVSIRPKEGTIRLTSVSSRDLETGGQFP